MKLPLRRIFHVVDGIGGIVIATAIFAAINYSHRNAWLIWAAQHGHPTVAHFLLKAGIGVDIEDDKHCTPLYWAAYDGQFEVARLLMAHHANTDVNFWECAGNGLGAHDIAARRGYSDLALWFFQQGQIDPLKSETSLAWAASRGYRDIVTKLLNQGTDVNQRGGEALRGAGGAGQDEIVELLIARGADPLVKDEHGSSLLHLAAEKGHAETAALLISQGLDPNGLDERGRTPLWTAVCGDQVEVLRMFFNHGVEIEPAPDELYCLDLCGLETIILLFDHGLSVGVRDAEGNTLLHRAVRRNYLELAKLVLSLGADVNGRNERGQTALFLLGEPIYPVRETTSEITELLLDSGAELDIHDAGGKTPLVTARERLAELEAGLRDQGLSPNQALVQIQNEIIQRLEAATAKPTSKGSPP
jgi:ankyrin repeat protein